MCKRHQKIFVQFIDTDLGYFCQINITGMYVHNQICSRQIFNNLMCHILCHGTVSASRKNAVHIKVKSRNPPRHRINSHRIHRWIYIHDSRKKFWMLPDAPYHLITNILPFEFITVNTSDNPNPLFLFMVLIRRHQPVFPDIQYLSNRQFHLTDGMNLCIEFL